MIRLFVGIYLKFLVFLRGFTRTLATSYFVRSRKVSGMFYARRLTSLLKVAKYVVVKFDLDMRGLYFFKYLTIRCDT